MYWFCIFIVKISDMTMTSQRMPAMIDLSLAKAMLPQFCMLPMPWPVNFLLRIFKNSVKSTAISKVCCYFISKVEKILKSSLNSTPSPTHSLKIQIMGGKFAWGVKAKHCWVLTTNFWKQKVCWHLSSSKNSPPIIWIFTEGDGIESRLSSWIFSNLVYYYLLDDFKVSKNYLLDRMNLTCDSEIYQFNKWFNIWIIFWPVQNQLSMRKMQAYQIANKLFMLKSFTFILADELSYSYASN